MPLNFDGLSTNFSVFWIWHNKNGNREQYSDCADMFAEGTKKGSITIEGHAPVQRNVRGLPIVAQVTAGSTGGFPQLKQDILNAPLKSIQFCYFNRQTHAANDCTSTGPDTAVARNDSPNYPYWCHRVRYTDVSGNPMSSFIIL